MVRTGLLNDCLTPTACRQNERSRPPLIDQLAVTGAVVNACRSCSESVGDLQMFEC